MGQNAEFRYCAEADGCDHDDWSALTQDDAIPGENPYTFDGENLIIDLHHGNYFEDKVVFDCEGADHHGQQRLGMAQVGSQLGGLR